VALERLGTAVRSKDFGLHLGSVTHIALHCECTVSSPPQKWLDTAKGKGKVVNVLFLTAHHAMK
jgi:hypothetical protein